MTAAYPRDSFEPGGLFARPQRYLDIGLKLAWEIAIAHRLIDFLTDRRSESPL